MDNSLDIFYIQHNHPRLINGENYMGKKRNPANTVFYGKSYLAYTNRPTGITAVSINKQKDSNKINLFVKNSQLI